MVKPWMSVVVPTYNEQGAIVDTVAALCQRLEQWGRPYELVVVDNASGDRTVEVLQPLVEAGQVRLLRNDANRGKGYSVRRGMLEAKGELRLLCDADCVPSLSSLPRLVELIEGADVVAGSRIAEGAQVSRTQPLPRRLVGSSFILLTRLVMLEPTRDVYCGFKLWRDAAAVAVFSRQGLDGWVFDAESLAMARRLGFRVREAGISWADREGSRLEMRQLLLSAVGELLQARRNVRRMPRRSRPGRAAVPAAPDLVEPER